MLDVVALTFTMLTTHIIDIHIQYIHEQNEYPTPLGTIPFTSPVGHGEILLLSGTRLCIGAAGRD